MKLILAHRGSSSEAPENTLASIKRAIELGVDYVEIDIHLTKDQVPIVIHDPTFTRTTNFLGEKRVRDTYLSELKGFDAGSWFDQRFCQERLPTLSEVLNLDFKDTGLMIEIKNDTLPTKLLVQTILTVVDECARHKKLPAHCFGSFDTDVIREIQTLSPKSKTVGIIEEVKFVLEFTRMQVDTMAIWHEIVNQEMIASLKSNNFEIWTFTVDDVTTARRLIDMGIEGIISNAPYLFQGNFDSKKAR